MPFLNRHIISQTCFNFEDCQALSFVQVREEQAKLRPDTTVPINGEVLYQMTYARQVVKEVLRYRAPAPMVPLLAQKAFQLTDDFKVPKGTLLMPSLHTACLEVTLFLPHTIS